MDDEPVWLARARRELGVKEKPGLAHHPRILEYLATTRITPKLHQDETPWCSAFVCWVMEGCGIPSTRSAAARSWGRWGKTLTRPAPGCVVVLRRTDNPAHGHVGFYLGHAGHDIEVLGGNQRNAVSIQMYPEARVLTYRWPDL